MKTDAERQTEYQQRRRETESRITIWVSKDTECSIDAARGSESRTAWINRAIAELIEDSGPRDVVRMLSLAELKTG